MIWRYLFYAVIPFTVIGQIVAGAGGLLHVAGLPVFPWLEGAGPPWWFCAGLLIVGLLEAAVFWDWRP